MGVLMLLILDIPKILKENILLSYRVTRFPIIRECYQIETFCAFPQSQKQDHLGHGPRWPLAAYSFPPSDLL